MNCNKYRLRWFSSKGAFLVLMWTLLLTIASISFTYSFKKSIHLALSDYPSISKNWLGLIPLSAAMFIAPLSGWLADAKFGNYRVFRAGTVLLFMSTMINCLLLIIVELVSEDYKMLRLVLISLTASMFGIGICACAVTSLPLCLNQMPDASSSNITNVIAWFVFILFIGEFLSRFIVTLEENCLLDGTMLSNYALIMALISSLCMSGILISNFLFHPIWLIIEPQSQKSLKTIYQVLKFAAKHKAPLDRSAFTYWENDIPSRIDLGKSKYGGPFTTEQVEDVKTMLRLLTRGAGYSSPSVCLRACVRACMRVRGPQSYLAVKTFHVQDQYASNDKLNLLIGTHFPIKTLLVRKSWQNEASYLCVSAAYDKRRSLETTSSECSRG